MVEYRVTLSKRAKADLASKVRSSAVKQDLLHVAEVALDAHEPPDGGMEETPEGLVYWRRGLTVAERNQLDHYEAQGYDQDSDSEKARDFGFTYITQWSPVTGRGWLIIAIWHRTDIAAGLILKPGQKWLT